jgi:hypothetical protein
MPNVEGMIEGPWLTTCNCDIGCPCQFNSLPTHGNCRAAVGCEISKGHFGEVRLDGVRFAAILAWPGPIHEGGGEVQPIVDAGATAAQRDAILTIMKGEQTEPGATIFNVFSATIDKLHEPLFLPIEFQADVEKRVGRIVVPGVLDVTSQPIRNPVTGEELRARFDMPNGFEFSVAEVAGGTAKTGERASVALDWQNSHAHFVDLHWTQQGVVR